jgi:hypothetical protein
VANWQLYGRVSGGLFAPANIRVQHEAVQAVARVPRYGANMFVTHGRWLMMMLITGLLALTGCGGSAPSTSSSAPVSGTSPEQPSLPRL